MQWCNGVSSEHIEQRVGYDAAKGRMQWVPRDPEPLGQQMSIIGREVSSGNGSDHTIAQ
jgi:hypothetical protein